MCLDRQVLGCDEHAHVSGAVLTDTEREAHEFAAVEAKAVSGAAMIFFDWRSAQSNKLRSNQPELDNKLGSESSI